MPGRDNKRALTREQLLTISERIEGYTTITDLLNGTAEQMGVTFSCYMHFPAVGALDFSHSGVFHSFNVPEFIVDYYSKSSNYFNDPVIEKVLNTGRFAWLSDYLLDSDMLRAGYNSNVQFTLDSIGDAIGFPLFGPNYRKAFTFTSFGGRGKDMFDPVMPYQLQALLQIMHIRYCQLVKGRQRQIKLTLREAEVLELISYGKTNSEIAQILGNSSRTIDGHVSKIFMKLGVNDRVNAALRAQSITIKI